MATKPTVKDLMHTPVITVTPETSLTDFCALLESEKIHGCPVVEPGGKPIGVVSSTDLAQVFARDQAKKFSRDFFYQVHPGLNDMRFSWPSAAKVDADLPHTIKDIMCERLVTAEEWTAVEDLARVMLREKVNRVLILDRNERLAGIVSATDIVRYVASGSEVKIQADAGDSSTTASS